MSKPIPNYTESLKECFHTRIEIKLIDNEVRHRLHDRELTMLPSHFGTPTNT